jgi:hypothetical protein
MLEFLDTIMESANLMDNDSPSWHHAKTVEPSGNLLPPPLHNFYHKRIHLLQVSRSLPSEYEEILRPNP